jgi:hypothetical protein
LTRTGLDWTAKYPAAIAALENLNVKSAYIDGELCGVDDAGSPSFAQMQAATDRERGARLVYYAFDLLHLDGWDVSNLSLIDRKPLLANKPGLQFRGHEAGDGEVILKHAGTLGFEGPWPSVLFPSTPKAMNCALRSALSQSGDEGPALCGAGHNRLARLAAKFGPGISLRDLTGRFFIRLPLASRGTQQARRKRARRLPAGS